MKNVRVYFKITICLALMMCQSKADKQLTNYLINVHHIYDSKKYNVYIFLPQNSCESCLSKLVTLLSSHPNPPKNLVVIVAGMVRAETLPLQKELERYKNHIIVDVGYNYLNYSLISQSTPFYLFRSNSGDVSINAVTSESWPLAERQLINLLYNKKSVENFKKLITKT